MDYLQEHVDTLASIGKGVLAGAAIGFIFTFIAPPETRVFAIMHKGPEAIIWAGIVGGLFGLAKDHYKRNQF